MKRNVYLGWGLLIFITMVTSCSKQFEPTFNTSDHTFDNIIKGNDIPVVSMVENFDAGSKTLYAAANVNLSTGSWLMDNALLGNSIDDHKGGSQAARITNSGHIDMNFNFGYGVAEVQVSHAVYANDAASTWELWLSSDNGINYYKAGNTITTSSATLQVASFKLNEYSNTVRISIRKISGGTNSINIDDVTVTSRAMPLPPDDDHVLMGNPSNATTELVNFSNYFMNKGFYSLSYNENKGTPNWVSWHLMSSDIGSTPRQDDFRADNTLPMGWYQVNEFSYSGSGFDRGHNCPSGDRTSTVAANSATFLMTNMIPQAPNNNQNTWANLESYTRSLVSTGNEVYVIMGAYGVGGTGSNGTTNTINNGYVTVPSNIWKVIVVVPSGDNDLYRVNTSTRVIAVNTPNINSINSNWRNYRVSVDAIEAATGYNLLSHLPLHVQAAVESVVDNL
jgi:endonuclease G